MKIVIRSTGGKQVALFVDTITQYTGDAALPFYSPAEMLRADEYRDVVTVDIDRRQWAELHKATGDNEAAKSERPRELHEDDLRVLFGVGIDVVLELHRLTDLGFAPRQVVAGARALHDRVWGERLGSMPPSAASRREWDNLSADQRENYLRDVCAILAASVGAS